MRGLRPDRSSHDGERGSFTLELTVLFPMFLLLLLLIVQAALYFFARAVALSAAQEGAREARLQDHTLSEGSSAASRFATRQGNGVLTGTRVSTIESTPTDVTIVVTGHPLAIIPGFGAITIRQTATAPKERYTTATGTNP